MKSFSEKNTIIKLYEEYVSKNTIPNKKYIQLKEEFTIALDDLMDNISEDKKVKVERVCECLLKMSREQETNAFVEGYTLGTNLTTEAINRGLK